MGGGSYIYFIIPSWSSNIFRYPWRSGEKENSEYSWAVIHIYILSFLAKVQISLDIPEEVVRKGTPNIHGRWFIYILSFLAKVQISLDIPEEVVRKGTPNIHGRWSRRLGNLPASNLQGTTNCAAAFDFQAYSFYHLCFSVSDKICQTKLRKGEFDTWRLCLSLGGVAIFWVNFKTGLEILISNTSICNITSDFLWQEIWI